MPNQGWRVSKSQKEGKGLSPVAAASKGFIFETGPIEAATWLLGVQFHRAHCANRDISESIVFIDFFY